MKIYFIAYLNLSFFYFKMHICNSIGTEMAQIVYLPQDYSESKLKYQYVIYLLY